MMSGHALASLTATYTDSEGEDDIGDEQNDKSPGVENSVHSAHSNAGTATPPIPKVDIRMTTTTSTTTTTIAAIATATARLVSYHDDTIVSDDEGNIPDISDLERRKSISTEPEPEPVVDGIRLFPEPQGRCSNELQEKINRLHEKMQSSGLDMNHVIQQRKDFRNPSIYEKLIQFCSIKESRTNYPPHIYDPLCWGKESYYEELAKVQKAEMDKHEKERKDRTKVEFVSGTAKRPGSGSGAEDEAKRRKSKWDQVGTVIGSNLVATQQNILKPAGLLQQPSLTTSATGTKSTVISAFGSLPRKPRLVLEANPTHRS